MHRVLFRIFVPVLLAAVTACGSSEDRRENYLRKAQQRLTENNPTEAVLEAKNAIQVDPKHAPAYVLLGSALMRAGDLRGAFGAYLRATELKPEDGEAQLALGRLLLLANQLGEAEAKARLVLGQTPDSIDAKLILATVHLRQGNVPSARSLLDEIIRLVPDREEPYYLLSEVLVREEKGEEALSLLRSGIRRRPDSRALKLRLAALLAGAKAFEEAQGIYQQLIAEDPSDQHKMLLVDLLQRSGRAAEAVTMLDELIRQKPAEEDLRLAKARLYAVGGDLPSAIKGLNASLADIKPGYGLRFALSDLLIKTGNVPGGEEVLGEIVKMNPEHPKALEARRALASAYLGRGETDRAKEQLAAVFERNQNDMEAHLLRGRLYLEEGEPSKAIPDLHQLEAQLLLAQAHFMNNEPLIGVEVLRQLLVRNPDNAAARKALVDYYIRAKDYDRAIQELNRMAQKDSEAALARLAVGDIQRLKSAPEKAEKEYLAVLKEYPQVEVQARLRLGGLALAKGAPEEALRQYEEGLTNNPQSYELVSAKIETLLQLKRNDQARALVRSLLGQAPDAPLVLDLAGRVEAILGNPGQAENLFFRAMEAAPKWVTPYYHLASIHLLSGQADRGIETYEQALKQNPESLRTLLILAILYQETGRTAQAEEAYKRILARQPNFLPAANNLAYLYAETSRDPTVLEQALTLAVKAAKDNSPHALDTLGWVYFKKGNKDMALDMLGRAWAADTGNEDIGQHLARVQADLGDKAKAKEILAEVVRKNGESRLKPQTLDLLRSL
jgi:tetratricopeptide (TPR) repeat protein